MNVSTTSRRGRYASGMAAQERILREASVAFATYGYRGASLDEIAKTAELTKQGLLYHYPSKQALVAAVMEHRDEVDLSGWPDRETLVGTQVLDALDRVVERNVELIGLVRLSHVMCAESSGQPEHPAHQYFVHHFDRGRQMLIRAFEAGVEVGELRDDIDYQNIALQVVAMLEGLENQWLFDPSGLDIVAVFHNYTQGLRQLITKTPALATAVPQRLDSDLVPRDTGTVSRTADK